MKSLVHIKKVLLSVAFLAICGVLSAGNDEPHYYKKDLIKDGQVVERETYKDIKGKQIKVHEYEYSYDENGELSCKKTYAWHKKSEKWYMLSRVFITKHGDQTFMEIEKWNASGKKSVKSSNLIIFAKDRRDRTYPRYVFRKDSDCEQWKVTDNSLFLTQE